MPMVSAAYIVTFLKWLIRIVMRAKQAFFQMKADHIYCRERFFTSSRKSRYNRHAVLHILSSCYIVLQYNRLNECITNGGGICRLATSEEKLTDLSELISDNALVMSVDSNTLSSLDHNTKEWVQKVFSFVKR